MQLIWGSLRFGFFNLINLPNYANCSLSTPSIVTVAGLSTGPWISPTGHKRRPSTPSTRGTGGGFVNVADTQRRKQANLQTYQPNDWTFHRDLSIVKGVGAFWRNKSKGNTAHRGAGVQPPVGVPTRSYRTPYWDCPWAAWAKRGWAPPIVRQRFENERKSYSNNEKKLYSYEKREIRWLRKTEIL